MWSWFQPAGTLVRGWATERLVKWQCKRSQGVSKSSCMTGYARQHQCHWPKSSCWNYLDVCGRDICDLGKTDDSWAGATMRNLESEPLASHETLCSWGLPQCSPRLASENCQDFKKRVEIFETCWRIGCIWCIRVDSLNNLNLFHQGNPTLKCFFHRCSACVWVFGVFYRGLGFATGCLWPHGKAGQGSNEMPNDAPGGGQGGQLNHGGRWLKKCWKCSKPNDKRFFGETADCLFLGFTTLDVSNGFCGSGLVPAALPQLGLGQTRGSVADIGGIDQAHEGCVPLEGHAGAGEIECIFLKNLICIQFGLAILKVQKWLRQGCLRFCNRRRQISGLLVLGFVGRSSNVSSPKKIDSS